MELVSLVVAVGLILLAGPILAVIALAKIARLDRWSATPLPPDVEARLDSLETRVEQLNQSLHALNAARELSSSKPKPTETLSGSPSIPAPPLKALSQTQTPLPSAPPRKTIPTGGLDLETLIAGRWLNRVGIVALLLAASFFLKYAFDNDWVGPSGRVALGLLAGIALLLYSQWLLRQGYGYFSGGIAGLAAGVLYLSLYAAWSFYQLVPQPVAFAGMIVVTGTMVVLALGRDSQPLALLALVGGFLTPILLDTGKDTQVPLFLYLAVLNGGLMVMARLRSWRSLELVAFVGTVIYYWGWVETFYDVSKLERTAFFATLFFVEFTVFPIFYARQHGKIPPEHVVLVLANATSFLVALQYLLYRDHRWVLTGAVLVLAAAHLAAMRLLPAPQASQRSVPRLLFAGLALTFVTLAIPIRLESRWIAIAWAVEGAVLVWSGFQGNLRLLRWAGIVLFGGAAACLILFEMSAQTFLWNPRFLTYAMVVVCFTAAFVFSRRHQEKLSLGEGRAFDVVGLSANAFLLSALSMEVWELFGRMQLNLGEDTRLTQQLALSLLWTVYATALILWGVGKGSPALRWSGLALFSIVVVKVFLYDLSFLERVYRIASFTVLGVLLVVVSFFYQQRAAAERPRDPSSR